MMDLNINTFPKIIHQIWVGNRRPIPHIDYRLKLQQLHPDWSYILWTDDMVREYALYNRCDYENYSFNPAIQADMLRYQIIHDFGGVYLDIDFEPIKPMDELFVDNSIHFYCCGIWKERNQICNGFFAAKPRSKILQMLRLYLDKRYRLKDYHRKRAVYVSGPEPFGIVTLNCIKKKIETVAVVPYDCFYSKQITPNTFARHHSMKSWIPKNNPDT